jgi:sugar O-acyltransferase (sialic acid O-acetyltransferase NeuD family)
MSVIVFGSGQIGRLAASILKQCGEEVVGFVDDSPENHGNLVDGVEVIGSRDALKGLPSIKVCNGVGTIKARKAVSNWLEEQGVETVNAVHPSVVISPETEIGRNVMIGSACNFFGPVSIGDGCYIGPSVTVSHDTSIGKYCLLSVGTVVGARVDVGNEVFIGTASTLLPTGFGELARLQVSDGATIGAGALVIRNVAAGATVVGRPAKELNKG